MFESISILCKKFLNTFVINNFFFFKYRPHINYWKNTKNKNFNHNYTKYLELDYDAKLLVKKICQYSNNNHKILDICCNVGRHLSALNKLNYNNIYGFDVNKKAINNIATNFKNLKKIKSNFTCMDAKNYFIRTEDKFFDVVYTHGATVELIPPTFDLIFEISRIVKKFAILLINENGHAFPRFWRYEFNKNNFKIIEDRPIKNSSLVLFVLKKIR
jgi:SAM-dependent methyltransferase